MLKLDDLGPLAVLSPWQGWLGTPDEQMSLAKLLLSTWLYQDTIATCEHGAIHKHAGSTKPVCTLLEI